jgi:hypothetical protein
VPDPDPFTDPTDWTLTCMTDARANFYCTLQVVGSSEEGGGNTAEGALDVGSSAGVGRDG